MNEYDKVRLDLLGSKAVQKYQKSNDLIILPVGCVEMHGPNIPLGCDAINAWAAAIILAKEWNCLVAPPIYYTYPGASASWPGTVNIMPEISQEYIKAVVKALIKNGFKRVVLYGTHGPLNAMFTIVIRSIFNETGDIVAALQSNMMPEDLMKEKLGYLRGEDILVLSSLKILGRHGVYDPKCKVNKPMEFPFQVIADLKNFGGSGLVPWVFKADYQHTGFRRGIKMSDADKGVAVIKLTAKRMKNFPAALKTYQKQMAKLMKSKPWLKDKIWSL